MKKLARLGKKHGFNNTYQPGEDLPVFPREQHADGGGL
jgi:hypothetical protein